MWLRTKYYIVRSVLESENKNTNITDGLLNQFDSKRVSSVE